MELSIVVGLRHRQWPQTRSPVCLALSPGLTKRGRRTLPLLSAPLRSTPLQNLVVTESFRTRLVTQIRRLRAVPCGIMLTIPRSRHRHSPWDGDMEMRNGMAGMASPWQTCRENHTVGTYISLLFVTCTIYIIYRYSLNDTFNLLLLLDTTSLDIPKSHIHI